MVTGGGSGIGRELVIQLMERGASVIALGLREEHLKELGSILWRVQIEIYIEILTHCSYYNLELYILDIYIYSTSNNHEYRFYNTPPIMGS